MTNNFSSINDAIDFLHDQGIVAINFCCFESAGSDIEHYQLLQSGEEASPDCFDIERVPLISEFGKAILLRFLKGEGVQQKIKKIASIDKADFKMQAFLRDMYPYKMHVLHYRKNYQTGKIDVFVKLNDEIQPLMVIKKRGRKRFEGILGGNS